MTQRGKVLGITDGRTWAALSTVSGTSQGVWFLNPRPLALPARAQAVTFPDAQHGYLVGPAMVYRYRIVPIDYTRQGMIAAMAP